MVWSWLRTSLGPHDVVPSVRASSLDELGRRIVFRIQVLDGITHTLT
jgi:hypothetical protein